MKLCFSVFFSLLCLIGPLARAHADEIPTYPSWVWFGTPDEPGSAGFRKAFDIPGDLKFATVIAAADDHVHVYLNGEPILEAHGWSNVSQADVTKLLRPGRNALTFHVVNDGGPGAATVGLRYFRKDDTHVDVFSDGSWKATGTPPADWKSADYDDSAWENATDLGMAGKPGLIWSDALPAEKLAAALTFEFEGRFLPEVASRISPPDGFVVETVFQVPQSMGSWVALTKDDQGRLIASDQGGAGLYLITPGSEQTETLVRRLPVAVTGAQGLCWANDSLYVAVNGGAESGVHRVTDSDNDGILDSSTFIMPIPGSGEHGPHGIIPGPDGTSLYVCAGNDTKLPDGITSSRIPQNWDEDLLLPRLWDPHGHGTGAPAPGAWILKMSPDGLQREVYSIGLRNHYDIAFNADNELFTFDSDMEWDLGTPWYRPTRVCHVTSGSEFGWRGGTGKWPEHSEDSVPPVINIGPGSPVGIVFGYGTKFPEKYQRSLFLLDWTYSTIYAVHLSPEGSSYHADKDDFLQGQPMQVTDAIVGDDGMLYFTTGGRGTTSSLYRIRYTGSESVAPVNCHESAGLEARNLRQKLESYHGQSHGDLELILSCLNHKDRFIRYAARIALEFQPLNSWRGKVLGHDGLDSLGATIGLMALARQGTTEDLNEVLQSLGKIDVSQLNEQGQLALLRAYQLALIRLGAPHDAWKNELIRKFEGMYPSASNHLNEELVKVLVYLDAPSVVAKTFEIMDSLGSEPVPDWGDLIQRSQGYGGTVGKMLENMPPVRALHYAFVLRNQKSGWTIPERQRYFQFLIDASKHPGGSSYEMFLAKFREDAVQTCNAEERIAVEPLIKVSLTSQPPEVIPPEGPGRKWTREEILEAVDGKLHGQKFDRGRNLFFAASCAKCHRLNGEGGAIGPDLSTAGKKFSLADLADAIVEPSKTISDLYLSHQIATEDGRVLHGRLVTVGNNLHVYTADPDAPPLVIAQDEVDEIAPSKISQMPAGLIDSLNPEELRELMAYLLSGANQHADFYRK